MLSTVLWSGLGAAGVKWECKPVHVTASVRGSLSVVNGLTLTTPVTLPLDNYCIVAHRSHKLTLTDTQLQVFVPAHKQRNGSYQADRP